MGAAYSDTGLSKRRLDMLHRGTYDIIYIQNGVACIILNFQVVPAFDVHIEPYRIKTSYARPSARSGKFRILHMNIIQIDTDGSCIGTCIANPD